MTASLHHYPEAVLRAAEMSQVGQTMSQINEAHEQRKEETDEINQEVYNG